MMMNIWYVSYLSCADRHDVHDEEVALDTNGVVGSRLNDGEDVT